MILQFLVAGTSGILIALYVIGLKNISDIYKSWKAGTPIKVAISTVTSGTSLKKFLNWLYIVWATMITLMLVIGLVISITMG